MAVGIVERTCHQSAQGSEPWRNEDLHRGSWGNSFPILRTRFEVVAILAIQSTMWARCAQKWPLRSPLHVSMRLGSRKLTKGVIACADELRVLEHGLERLGQARIDKVACPLRGSRVRHESVDCT